MFLIGDLVVLILIVAPIALTVLALGLDAPRVVGLFGPAVR